MTDTQAAPVEQGHEPSKRAMEIAHEIAEAWQLGKGNLLPTIAAHFDKALTSAIAGERAAIVAWLRGEAEKEDATGQDESWTTNGAPFRAAADQVEAGAHLPASGLAGGEG